MNIELLNKLLIYNVILYIILIVSKSVINYLTKIIYH